MEPPKRKAVAFSFFGEYSQLTSVMRSVGQTGEQQSREARLSNALFTIRDGPILVRSGK